MLRQHASLLLFVYLFIIIYNQNAGAVGYKKRVRGRHEEDKKQQQQNRFKKQRKKKKRKKKKPTDPPKN